MITTNTGAKKIEGTDNWRQIFDAHNDSVDAHDKISDAMTYVVNGNKSIESVSIPVGHYFRLANSSIAGRSDGLYTAKIAIPVDTVIDATYFNEAAPITGGIAEALNSKTAKFLYTLKQGVQCSTTEVSVGLTPSDFGKTAFSSDDYLVFVSWKVGSITTPSAGIIYRVADITTDGFKIKYCSNGGTVTPVFSVLIIDA